MKRLALLLVATGIAAGVLVAGSMASGRQAARPVAGKLDPQVAMGAHLFVRFACSACHGYFGQGGISPYVPALKPLSKVLTATQLRSFIYHGLGESKNPKKPYMPVWGAVISDAQIADIVAYIRAGFPVVEYATPVPIPTNQGPAVAGMALYQRYGCENCHGPNGLGGVPNPLSADKAIPALAGKDFRKEFSDAEIMAIIRSGSVIGEAPITSMPHWGGIIPEKQLRDLVAYLKTLK